MTHSSEAAPAILTAADLASFQDGTARDLHRRLGAHPWRLDGVDGVHFAVWAPNALEVGVIGSFNDWKRGRHPMRPCGETGVWEVFIPGVPLGTVYKFDLKTRLGGAYSTKADPFGFRMERRPETASIVWSLDQYHWNDGEWLSRRAKRQGLGAPISIYEVHLGSWRRGPKPEVVPTAGAAGRVDAAVDERPWLSYRELAEQLVPYAVEMGFTHLELMPITEHPFDGSWGYQTVGYFAPTSRYGTPDDFREFVDRAHQAGLGIILDWVPAHFPTDAHGLGFFDGTHLYEHADPRQGRHMDWGTSIYNFGRPQVCAFLISSALFWIEEYHIDGLRVDAVASMLYLDYSRQPGEWVPNQHGGRENIEAIQFLRDLNRAVHESHPGVVTFAEESTAWPMVSRPEYLGGLGFDFKWNMGWMHDMLDYMQMDPIYRRHHQSKLTFSMFYAFSENFLLPLSHDEVVHGKRSLLSKMPGDMPKRFANLRALYGYMIAHPGKKLLFMGGEFGQWIEWNHEGELDWGLLEFETHRGVSRWVQDLNRAYAAEPALHEVDDSWDGFQWIDCNDMDRSVVSLIRRGRNRHDYLVVVANLTPIQRVRYRIGVPAGGPYRELLNSDSAVYGGTNGGNMGRVEALPEVTHGLPFCLELLLPPLSVLFLKPELPPEVREREEAARLALEAEQHAAEGARMSGEEDALAAAQEPEAAFRPRARKPAAAEAAAPAPGPTQVSAPKSPPPKAGRHPGKPRRPGAPPRKRTPRSGNGPHHPPAR